MTNGLLPNSQPYGQQWNGGNPGALVTAGQFAMDWLQALGGVFTLTNQNQGFTYTMPLDGTGLQPVAIPQDLATMLINYRESVLAALQGVNYPPLPPTQCAWPW